MVDFDRSRTSVSAGPAAGSAGPRRGPRGHRATAAVAAFVLLVAACGGSAAPASGGSGAAPPATAPPGGTTMGSNASDAVPKAGIASMTDYCTKQTGVGVAINTTEHNAFQNALNSYLQATPDDIFTWFAGHRMQFFAQQGLATQIDDVWAQIGANQTEPMKAASTGLDGHMYFVPIYNYPWVVMYNKTLWDSKGYLAPKTWDEFLALLAKMKTDGVTPIAFADKDGWPAMGTFDIINMRQNGYQFHVDLMAGKEKWTDSRVKDVFTKWQQLLPYYQEGALGRTWQEGAKSMINKEAGMYFLGTFAGQQATADQLKELDFFAFPTFGNQYDAEMAIDAPIDGFMLSKAPKNLEGAKKILACFGTGAAQNVYLKTDANDVAVAKDADTSGYNDFQKKSLATISAATKIAQFLDRDTRPDFAGPQAMQKNLQNFLQNPTQDLDAYLKGIQAQWDALPAE